MKKYHSSIALLTLVLLTSCMSNSEDGLKKKKASLESMNIDIDAPAIGSNPNPSINNTPVAVDTPVAVSSPGTGNVSMPNVGGVTSPSSGNNSGQTGNSAGSVVATTPAVVTAPSSSAPTPVENKDPFTSTILGSGEKKDIRIQLNCRIDGFGPDSSVVNHQQFRAALIGVDVIKKVQTRKNDGSMIYEGLTCYKTTGICYTSAGGSTFIEYETTKTLNSTSYEVLSKAEYHLKPNGLNCFESQLLGLEKIQKKQIPLQKCNIQNAHILTHWQRRYRDKDEYDFLQSHKIYTGAEKKEELAKLEGAAKGSVKTYILVLIPVNYKNPKAGYAPMISMGANGYHYQANGRSEHCHSVHVMDSPLGQFQEGAFYNYNASPFLK